MVIYNNNIIKTDNIARIYLLHTKQFDKAF